MVQLRLERIKKISLKIDEIGCEFWQDKNALNDCELHFYVIDCFCKGIGGLDI